MKLYAVMFTETDGCEYSMDICLGVYGSEEKAQEKIDKDVNKSSEIFSSDRFPYRNGPPINFGCYPNEYYILECNLNEEW